MTFCGSIRLNGLKGFIMARQTLKVGKSCHLSNEQVSVNQLMTGHLMEDQDSARLSKPIFTVRKVLAQPLFR